MFVVDSFTHVMSKDFDFISGLINLTVALLSKRITGDVERLLSIFLHKGEILS